MNSRLMEGAVRQLKKKSRISWWPMQEQYTTLIQAACKEQHFL